MVLNLNCYPKIKTQTPNYMNEETKDWKIASNTELKEECERLKKIFEEKQEEMKTLVEKINELNNSMVELSNNYVEVRTILNKREGKSNLF